MKNLLAMLSIAAIFMAGNVWAQDSLQYQKKNQHRFNNKNQSAMKFQNKGHMVKGFVDANGDGYNDNAPDADGDGIPNGRDADYTGSKMRHGNTGKGFVDADGDGINDNALDDDGDGIPNGKDPDFVRPQDGSGRRQQGMKGNGQRGAGMGNGSGNCDGTGPKGNKRGGKK